MKLKNFFCKDGNRRSQGFTFVEMMVATGLSGVLILGVYEFLHRTTKGTKKAEEALNKTITSLVVEKILKKDIFSAQYAYNNLKLLADEDNAAGEPEYFFDYLYDGQCMSNCARTYILEFPRKSDGSVDESKVALDDYSRSFYIIVADKSRTGGERQLYEPGSAYEEDTSASPPIAFVSINKDDVLDRAGSPWKKEDSRGNTVNNLLFLYSPTYLRKPGATISVDVGRYMSYLGWISDPTSTEISLTPEDIVNRDDGAGERLYASEDWRTDPPTVVNNEDVFLRTIPGTVGLTTHIFITAVKVVRYRLRYAMKSGRKNVELMRGELKYSSSGIEYVERSIANNIKSLTFYRSNISTPSVTFNLKYTKFKL